MRRGRRGVLAAVVAEAAAASAGAVASGGAAASAAAPTALATPAARPALESVELQPSAFAARRGTTLSLTLTGAAGVSVRITRTVHGRRIDHACVARGRRGRRCTRTSLQARLTFAGAPGANRFRLRVPNLSPGRYDATVSALGEGYRRAGPVRVKFRITR